MLAVNIWAMYHTGHTPFLVSFHLLAGGQMRTSKVTRINCHRKMILRCIASAQLHWTFHTTDTVWSSLLLLFWKIREAVQDFLEPTMTAGQSGCSFVLHKLMFQHCRIPTVREFSTTRLLSGGPLPSMHMDEPTTKVPATQRNESLTKSCSMPRVMGFLFLFLAHR